MTEGEQEGEHAGAQAGELAQQPQTVDYTEMVNLLKFILEEATNDREKISRACALLAEVSACQKRQDDEATSNALMEEAIQKALTKMEEVDFDLLRSIEVFKEKGWPIRGLTEAQWHLHQKTDPLAQGVADFQSSIHSVLDLIPDTEENEEIISLVKRADRAARDIVVLLCRSQLKDQRDRATFLILLQQAYRGNWQTEVRAQLLQSYHKDKSIKDFGFMSMNAALTDRRGWARAAPAARLHKKSRCKKRAQIAAEESAAAAAAWFWGDWYDEPQLVSLWDWEDNYLVPPMDAGDAALNRHYTFV